MHPPAAPAFLTCGRRSRLIPPIAYTGSGQALQIASTKPSPFPFSPFLHSVSKLFAIFAPKSMQKTEISVIGILQIIDCQTFKIKEVRNR